MALLPTQFTPLKTHLLANTNQATNWVTKAQAAINTLLTPDNGSYQSIADWYNGSALAGDNQPFTAPLMVWRPHVSIMELNSAVQWQTAPVGSTDAQVTNSWLLYQAMTQGGFIDMTDPQVRRGIIQAWGVQAAGNTTLGITTVGQQAARRIELVLRVGGLIGVANSGPQAYVSQVFGYQLLESDIRDAVTQG